MDTIIPKVWNLVENDMPFTPREEPLDVEYVRAIEGTLSEWAGAPDKETYCDL